MLDTNLAEYTVDDEGLTVYKHINNIHSVKIVTMPSYVSNVNREFLLEIEGDCLYLNNSIYYKLGSYFRLSNGNMVTLRDKDELADMVNKEPDGIYYIGDGNDTLITAKSFKRVNTFLSTTRNFEPLLDMILIYIESEFMCKEHNESFIVNADELNISSDIILADNIAANYDSFMSFFEAQYPNISNSMLTDINNVYSNLKFIIRKAIAGPGADPIELRKAINIHTNNSVALAYEYNRIRVVEYDSPSARRYKINCKITREENDGD